MIRSSLGFRASLCLAALIVLSACASRPKPMGPAATAAPPPAAQERGGPAPAPAEGSVSESEIGPPAPGTARDFVVNVGDRIYFDLDAYVLRDDARPVLAAQAAWLARYPAVRVRIEGNCDERGTREYNFALGARRAAAVKDFLISHGVASARVETVSYGKERPIDPGENEDAWAKNRNAHTAITEGAR
jgi:peptidoglycan-associated lipoprotein